MNEFARLIVQNLSASERELLRGIVAGESISTLALRLGMEESEAAAAKQLLMIKLGARTTADAVRIGICAGL